MAPEKNPPAQSPGRADVQAPPHAAARDEFGQRVTSRQRPAPFQFSVRSVLLLMVAAAVVLTVLDFVGFDFFGEVLVRVVALVLVVVVPLCSGVLACYCRGERQTFFLGVFASSLTSRLLFWGVNASSHAAVLAMHGVHAAIMVACGFLAIWVRRFAERRNWHVPPCEREKDSSD